MIKACGARNSNRQAGFRRQSARGCATVHVMTPDEFWSIIASARATTEPGRSPASAVVRHLAEASPEAILDYEEQFQEASSLLSRWDVWAAGYLIGGGCSDDRFMDFRAGIVSLGRDWYERVARNPDALARYEPVRRAAGARDDVIFDEEFVNAAGSAYRQLTGDDEEFFLALERRLAASGPQESARDMGEEFDFDDMAEMRRRLPRLAALYRRAGSRHPATSAVEDAPRTVEVRRVHFEAGRPVETVEYVPVGEDGRLSPEDLIAAMTSHAPPARE